MKAHESVVHDPAGAPASGAKKSAVSGARVMVALLVTIVAAPVLEQLPQGDFVEAVLITLVLCVGATAVGGGRGMLMAGLLLAAGAVAARWISHFRPDALQEEVFLTAAMITIGFVTYRFLRFVLMARRVCANVLCTGIASFLLLGLLWAYAYALVDRAVPGSFAYTVGAPPRREMSGFTALYFSLVTLCTVGFGDIVPATNSARSLAMLEGMAGVLFIAVFLSRLVSLYSAGAAPADDPRESGRS